MARPTKLNAEVQETIAKALLERSSREGACGLAGITHQTLLNWLERGATGEEPFATFFEVVKGAEAQAEADALKDLHTAENHWQRFAWWLERRFPDRWGRRDRTEVTGAGGGPLQVIIAPFDIAEEDGDAPDGDRDSTGEGHAESE